MTVTRVNNFTQDSQSDSSNYINAGKVDRDFNDLFTAVNGVMNQASGYRFTTTLLLPVGSGFAWDGDPDTGLFRLADGSILLKCNGVNKFALTPNVATFTDPVAVGTPTHADHATTKSYVDAATGNTSQVPTGGTLPYFGASAPEGYLLCNGATVSRTTYAALFAVIGTTHGTTDSTNFKVPDCRGMFLRGTDLSRGVDVNRTLGSQQEDATAKNGLTVSEAGAHTHGVVELIAQEPLAYGNLINKFWLWGVSWFNGSRNSSAYTKETLDTSSSGAHTHTLTGDSETRPVNLSCNFIIKT